MYEPKWRWCVVGNITKSHIDPDGTKRYGSSAYCGGTKVYIIGKTWKPTYGKAWVLGLDRDKMHTESSIDPKLIENVRLSRVYKPSILDMMNDFEGNCPWWYDTPEDRAEAAKFVRQWKKVLFPPAAR